MQKIALEKLQGSTQHTQNPFSACDRGMPTGVKKSCAWAGVQALTWPPGDQGGVGIAHSCVRVRIGASDPKNMLT